MRLMELLKAADGGKVVQIRCMHSVLNCHIQSGCYFQRGRIYDFTKFGEIYVIGIEKSGEVLPIKEYTLNEEKGHWTESLEKTLEHFEFAESITKESMIVEVVINENSTFVSQLLLEKLKKTGHIKKLYSDNFVEIFKNGENEEENIYRERIFYEVNTNRLASFCISYPDVARMYLPGEVYASWFKTNTLIELDIDPAELACYSV